MDIQTSSPFSQAFDYASGEIGRRFQNPVYPATELVTGAKLRASFKEVKKFGQYIVKAAAARRDQAALGAHQGRAKTEDSDDGNAEIAGNTDIGYGSLIDSFMDTIDDRDIVADAALNFLSAGKRQIGYRPFFNPAMLANADSWRRSRYNCTIFDLDILSADATPRRREEGSQ
jgi:hypothetical protein